MSARLIRGQTISFDEQAKIRHEENGAVAVSGDGKISWCGDFGKLPDEYKSLPVDDYDRKLILPGFIDPHIHFPQYRMLAAPGRDLLDWLNRFTFPEEAKYAVAQYAATAAEVFLDRLIQHGTTSALVFASSHKASADALFNAAYKRGMALGSGKTMMDCNAPDSVLDTAETSGIESDELIVSWHGKGRLHYAITPRFAVTSSREQLQVAAELLHRHPDLLMQTHLSENHAEIDFVANKFPDTRDYTDVYDKFGLLGKNSLFAHGIHLSAREKARLAESGSTIVHCPTSNTFLGSGLFDLNAATQAGVGVGLATDIAGGTSYSMLHTMAESYKVAMLSGYKPDVAQLYHMATLGNAKLLHQDSETGSLDQGKWADIIVLDPQATPVLKSRHELSQSIKGILFALMILGDDRAISATYIAGKRYDLMTDR